MDQAYSLDLHNCYFVDGDLMYHCGGCSCPTTPNSFATVIPAYHYDDSRRPRLTLTHLNKLKKMRKLKKLDLDKRYKFFKDIYGIPPAPPPV